MAAATFGNHRGDRSPAGHAGLPVVAVGNPALTGCGDHGGEMNMDATEWFLAVIYGLAFGIPAFRMLMHRRDRRELWDRAMAREHKRHRHLSAK
jgi:hypothetical protein